LRRLSAGGKDAFISAEEIEIDQTTDATTTDATTGKDVWNYPLLSNPGIFLYPDTNKLHIRFNTFDSLSD
jgi:hypothetical protein